MKLLKATIDGFGKWTDTTFDFSENMLYCFYGENESGKSTLQQFILYMLFGLPPKKRKSFIPKMRNGIGGSLIVHDYAIGNITIQRVDGQLTCFLPNGEVRNEIWWIAQLNNISKEVYSAVNAFSATDLQAIRTMDHAAVSDILFSIGLSGSTAIYEVEKQLTYRLEELYKRRGKKPVMNEQINKLTQAADALYRVKQNEAAYAPLIKKKEEEAMQITTFQEKLLDLKEQLIIKNKTIQSIPQVQSLQRNQELLAQYSSTISFPHNGLERYSHIKEKILPKLSELELLQNKQKEYEEAKELIKKELWTTEEMECAKQILQEKADYEQRKQYIERKNIERERKLEESDYLIHELGWNHDETDGAVLPFHLEDTWQQLADSQITLVQEQSSLEEERYISEEKRHRLLHDEKEIRSELLPDEERFKMEEQLASEKAEKNYLQQKKDYEIWKNEQEKKNKKYNYSFITAAVISSVLGFMTGESIFYGLTLLTAAGAVIQHFYAGHQTKMIENMLFNKASVKTPTEEAHAVLKQKLNKDSELKQQLSFVNRELRQNNLLQIQTEEQQQIMEKRVAQFDDRIESEQFTYPFLRVVEAEHWPELLKLVRELQAKNKAIHVIDQEIAVESDKNRILDQQLMAFPHGNSFSEIERQLDQQHENKSTLKQYERELESVYDSLIETEQYLDTFKKERDILFHTAEVDSEEAFYKRADDFAKKETLLTEIAAIREQLYQLFSKEKTEALLRTNIDSVALEAEKDQLERTIQEVEKSISTAHQHLGELQAEIVRLEEAEDSSQLSLAYEMEKNLLNEQAEEWAVLKLVESALQKAKQSYQEKHFSKVMELTSQFFGQLTDKRYHKVYPPEENGLFQVEGDRNIRYTVEELSQGTIDQLYVSLRFAIASAMREQFDLPLLIDDAFVHFDKKRTEQTIRLMEKLSADQQIIFFTCKEDVAAQFTHTFPMVEAMKIT